MTPSLPNQQGSEQEQLTQEIYRVMQIPYLSERHDAIKALIETEKRSTARDVCQAIVSKGPTDIDVSDINELADSGEQRAVQDCLLSNSINAQWRQVITEVEKEYE